MNLFSSDHISAAADKIWALALTFIPRLLLAMVIICVAMFVASRAARGLSRLLGRSDHIDPTLRFVVAEFVRYIVIIFALVIGLEQLGVRATSLLAALGAAGLAIGLALQGTLSNIAAGFMLLWLRPFRIGDYIEVNNVPGLAGVVRQIGLFTCQLEAFDGLYLFVPNSGLWNVPLRNYSRIDARLVSMTVLAPHAMAPETVKQTLLKLAADQKMIAKAPAPSAFVERVSGDGVLLNFRFWAEPRHVGELQRWMVDAVREALSAQAPKDAPPVQITRTVPPDTDPSRLMDVGDRARFA